MTRRHALVLRVALPRLWTMPLQLPQAKRLRRSESFFGMHFDLHPHVGDAALGREVTERMVTAFLEQVKPDSVQYDCKGHVGYLGYPSQVGPSAPVVNDSLAIWRKVTAERGVALYIHFSGVCDSRAVADHPEWARVRPHVRSQIWLMAL